MPLKERDFVLVEYTVRVKDTGEVIETTSEDVARSSGVYREGEVYGPKLLIVGEGRYVKGFEEAVTSSEVGDEKTTEVEPSKAYGERDPGKVKILSLRELAKLNITPEPGKAIEIGGAIGVVRRLMEMLEKLFTEKGALEARLEVRVSNEAAISLYRSLGYTIAGIYRGYYSDGEDAYIMIKTLSRKPAAIYDQGL